MTKIEYKINNKDAIDGYFYMLKNSNALRRKVAIFTLAIMITPIMIGVILIGTITATLIILSLLFGFIYALLLPWIASFLSSKNKKTVEISQEGMSISVDKVHKLIPWAWVEETQSNDSFLFILGKSGNFLCIPKSSFNSKIEMNDFMSKFTNYKNA